MRKKLCAFAWYGGKFSHLDWLLPKLPKCHHYVEPFGGSAAVLLNREPSPIETYNDLDGEVVNFFRVLRQYPAELQRQMALSPCSRADFSSSLTAEGVDDIERARRFYVLALHAYGGRAQAKLTSGDWVPAIGSTSHGVSGKIARSIRKICDMPDIAARLMTVQIENKPAIDVIRRYDSRETLFYCDPPYIHETRNDDGCIYAHEMNDSHHRELADALNSAVGKVALSNYDCDLMDELYSPDKWHKCQRTTRTTCGGRGERTEVLWTNYDPDGLAKRLF